MIMTRLYDVIIIRLNEMRATLASINMVDEKPCRIDVIIVSGTIKSLKNHFHPSQI